MGCKLTDIPNYNTDIKSPSMQMQIDRELGRAPKITEKQMIKIIKQNK